MKTLLLASVAALALSNAAHAANAFYSETCVPPVQSIGATGGKQLSVISIHAVYDSGSWRVVHQLVNGSSADRGVQYGISDASVVGADGLVYAKWVGTLRRNPAITMTGQLAMEGNVPHYLETMVKDGQTIMQSDAVCSFDGSSAPYAPPPAVTAYAPPPVVTAPTVIDRVPVSIIDNQAHIAVSLGSLPVPMLVDTGCTYMTVTQNVADQLLASGQATRTADGQTTLADGSTRTNASIVINTMTIGGHVLRNVWAGVSPNGADMLLGFNVLNMVSGKFAINSNASTLDFD